MKKEKDKVPMTSVANKKKFQSINVTTVSFAHLLHDIYSSFLAPILPLLIEKFSLSYSLAGLLSIAQRVPSLFSPVVGILADKFSIRYFLIVAPSITAICMSLLGSAPNYISLIILLLITGTSSVFFHIPASVMIKRLSGDELGKGMSFYMLGGEISRTLGPIMILGAVSLWGISGTYKLIPVGLFASIILYIKIGRIRISDDFKKNKKKNSRLKEIKKVAPIFIVVSSILFFRMILKGCLTTFLPTYLIGNGESLWMGGIAIAILQAAGAVVTIFSGTLSDKFGRKNIVIIASLASPIFMAFFLLTTGAFSMFMLVLLGFSIFATGPVFLAVINDIKTENPAFLNSIYIAMNFILSAFTIFIVGVMGDIFGLERTYIIAAFLSIFSVFFAFKL